MLGGNCGEVFWVTERERGIRQLQLACRFPKGGYELFKPRRGVYLNQPHRFARRHMLGMRNASRSVGNLARPRHHCPPGEVQGQLPFKHVHGLIGRLMDVERGLLAGWLQPFGQ